MNVVTTLFLFMLFTTTGHSYMTGDLGARDANGWAVEVTDPSAVGITGIITRDYPDTDDDFVYAAAAVGWLETDGSVTTADLFATQLCAVDAVTVSTDCSRGLYLPGVAIALDYEGRVEVYVGPPLASVAQQVATFAPTRGHRAADMETISVRNKRTSRPPTPVVEVEESGVRTP